MVVPEMRGPAGAGCKACLARAAELTRFDAAERMFGTGERFTYLECGACGTIQIAEVPADLSRHYPATYYAYHQKPRKTGDGWLARWRAGRILAKAELTGRRKGIWQIVEWLAAAGCRRSSRVLDAGCGDGTTLRRLWGLGFSSLQGVDPFLPADVRLAEGIPLWKRELAAMEGEFDAILMDHAFEHVAEPEAALRELRRLIAPGGAAILAMPLAGCDSWRIYRDAWCGLDAPRHLVIPSERGMRILAERAGLPVEEMHCYSTRHHLMWNEMYRRGVPLEGPGGIRSRNLRKEFGRAALREFSRKAAANNAAGKGDVAVYILRRKESPGK